LATGSVTAPRPIVPANNALINNQSQPVTLIVLNAVVTKPGDTTYTFEVATDVAFGSKVQTKDGVAEASGGQTSVRLDPLAPARDYYWRVRAQGGGTTGVFGAIFRFTVGAAVVLNAPTAVSPLNGTTTAGWPIFTVNNAPKSGPAGALTYRFEISTNNLFTTIVLAGNVPEGVNRTSFVPPANLAAPSQAALFWRATTPRRCVRPAVVSARPLPRRRPRCPLNSGNRLRFMRPPHAETWERCSTPTGHIRRTGTDRCRRQSSATGWVSLRAS